MMDYRFYSLGMLVTERGWNDLPDLTTMDHLADQIAVEEMCDCKPLCGTKGVAQLESALAASQAEVAQLRDALAGIIDCWDRETLLTDAVVTSGRAALATRTARGHVAPTSALALAS